MAALSAQHYVMRRTAAPSFLRHQLTHSSAAAASRQPTCGAMCHVHAGSPGGPVQCMCPVTVVTDGTEDT
ncbi:hypothetical protein EWB00_001635, partial [Schistosoma japonicum]